MPPETQESPELSEPERRRLARLRMLAVLDTEPEPVFDALVRIAAAVCGKPIGLISLIDSDRQWFKANLGLTDVSATPRDVAFCDHAIRQPQVMEVPDARDDGRFVGNPLVTGAPHIRFYAGAPIEMPGGERIGTLCVIDREPGRLTPQQLAALEDLAQVAQWALLQRERLYNLTVVGDESRFQAISHATPFGIFQADQDGSVFHVNGRWEALFGMDQDRALGWGWLAAVAPEDRERVTAAWRTAVASRQALDTEFASVAPGGEVRHLHVQARPARWGEPPRSGWVGVAADVTLRKEAERKRQAANDLLTAVVENIPCGLTVFDEDLRLITYNKQFRTLLDFPEALCESRPRYEDLVRYNLGRGDTGHQPVEDMVARLMKGARVPGVLHVQRERPNGVTLDVRAAPMPGGGLVTTFVDITPAKTIERALRESEERQKRALDASRLALWNLDLRTGRMYLSENWSQMLGGPPEPTSTTTQALIALVPRDEQQSLNDAIVALLAGRADHYLREHRVRRRDGSLLWIHSEGRVTERDADGRAVHVTGTNQDITARKEAEIELRRAREAAESANRAKTDFLDNVSHEIRTPLNGVLGMTRLLLAEPLTDVQRKYVQIAENSATSLLELINDLLDLGKIEAGRIELEQIPFRLDEVIAQLADLYTLRAREQGLRFTLEMAPDVPLEVSGDPLRLRQILNNLLSNALKFTQQGGIGLVVAAAGPGRGVNMVQFTVHDTGIGIAPEAQARLFTRFSQADSSTTRQFGGTGLGLAIVKELCERMGGSVRMQSEPGRGTSFRCELPLRPVTGDTMPPPPVEMPAVQRALRLLLAEDNPTNQIVARGLLAQAGYRDLTIAPDGRQAVDAALAGDFDLVLMDCRMPELDGYEATRELRRQGFDRPIVALTANASSTERQRCLAAGMDDYLTKPLDPLRLAQVLARWSDGRDVPADEAPAPPDAPGAGGFDRERSLQRLGGDEELLDAALGSFAQHTPQLLRHLGDALAQGRSEEAHRHLHSLAGSTAMIGADHLQAVARRLEALAAEGQLEPVREAWPALQDQVERFVAEASAGRTAL